MFAIISLSLFTYALLSHNPVMLLLMGMLQNSTYVWTKRSDVRNAYTPDRYECMSSDFP